MPTRFTSCHSHARFCVSVFLVLIWMAGLSVADADAQFLPRPEASRPTRMNYSNSSGEEGRTVYQYRRDGVLDSEIWMLKDHSRHSANYLVYDKAGLVTLKYREFSDGLTSTETYEYDEAGRCMKETFARSDGLGGSAGYQWDDAGLLVAADCDKYKGWLSGRIEYTHDGGRLVGAIIVRDEQTIGAVSYKYNHVGCLVSEVWDFNGRWSQKFEYDYEPVPARVFAAANPLMMRNTRFRVAGEDYDFNSEGGGPSTYSYDEQGRLEMKTFERNDGLKTETTYAYDDEQGNLLTSHRAYHDGRTADFAYSYDAARRLTRKSFRRSDGQEGFEAYTYDRFGRLDRADYQQVDFWLNGIITFSYDDWGRLSEGHFAGRDGFDAELGFTTDSNGNVLEIVWTLSSGMTQTYRFNYRPHQQGVPVTDPGHDPALVAALDPVLTPLPGGDPLEWKDSDLSWLDRYADTGILALGEATHGTREFTTARQRMFRYMVENHGYRVLAVEAHFAECLYLDRCLGDPQCDLEATMRDRMLIWTTQTREMLDLFQWIREYNGDNPESEWIHLVGYDSQVRKQIDELLRDILGESDSGLLAEVDRAFEPIADLNRAAYKEMDDDALADHQKRLTGLKEQLARGQVQNRLGRYEGTCAIQLAEAAIQSLEFLQQYFHHGKLIRDRFLTENVLWTTRLFGKGTKVVLWAHNAHIAAHEGYAPDAGGGMGWQLKQSLGDEYQTVGLVFSRGEFRAKVFNAAGDVTAEPHNVVFVVDPPDGSLNRLLEKARARNYFLDFDDVGLDTDLGLWLTRERPVLGVGDLFLGVEKIPDYHYGGDRVMSPTGSFDALIYLSDTHATEALSHSP
jgi:erythromycin esterase